MKKKIFVIFLICASLSILASLIAGKGGELKGNFPFPTPSNLNTSDLSSVISYCDAYGYNFKIKDGLIVLTKNQYFYPILLQTYKIEIASPVKVIYSVRSHYSVFENLNSDYSNEVFKRFKDSFVGHLANKSMKKDTF